MITGKQYSSVNELLAGEVSKETVIGILKLYEAENTRLKAELREIIAGCEPVLSKAKTTLADVEMKRRVDAGR